MSYAASTDLVEAFGELELKQIADRDRDGIADAAVVSRALQDADELINSYLAQRYTLPLPSVPKVLVSRACDVARFRLHKEGGHEEIRTRYEEAVSWLKDVVARRAGLGFPEADQQPEGEGSTAGLAEFTGAERRMSRESLDGL